MQWEVFLTSPSYTIGQGLFVKGVAFSYFLAFSSLLLQVKGLYGSKGIEPIDSFIKNLEKRIGKERYWKIPTLFWIKSSDTMLQATAAAGIFFSLLVMGGIFPTLSLFCTWFFYLSFLNCGSSFLSFQWDTLITEAGFIALFFTLQEVPPTLLIFLSWFFFFRFMLSAGLAKWLSHCPTWRQKTALDYHYYTQPIPNRIAWYAHQLPKIFSRIGCYATLIIEIPLTILLIIPIPEVRLAGVLIQALLQLTIMLTGNFAFFNLLTLAMMTPLINNSYYLNFFGFLTESSRTEGESNLFVTIAISLVVTFLLFLNSLQLLGFFLPLDNLAQVIRWTSPFRISNGYGLFARMTTLRNEIIVEGSNDGKVWKEYRFKWKPGDLKKAPSQVAPHQPRLDWQMWFAALGNYRQNRWFTNFLIRLLEGSEDVIALLENNPFPEKPPKYIRSLLYDYHFSDKKIKKEKGEWWTKSAKGAYTPVMSLQKSDNG